MDGMSGARDLRVAPPAPPPGLRQTIPSCTVPRSTSGRFIGWSRVRVRLGVELEREFDAAARGVSDEPLTRVSEVVER